MSSANEDAWDLAAKCGAVVDTMRMDRITIKFTAEQFDAFLASLPPPPSPLDSHQEQK